jgi:hypothetical protein
VSFVNREGEDEGELVERSVGAGAPPFEWDPDDPETVNVHYDLTAWNLDQRAELAEALAEGGFDHRWDGDELVVPEALEGAIDAMFAELEADLGPFPVVLGADEHGTEFGLDEWPDADRELLSTALVEAQIPHRWEGTTVIVAADAEHEVDDLLDAIERGDIASFDDAGGPPEGVIGTLFSIADRLARDPLDSGARHELLELAPLLHERQPPFGLAVREWGTMVRRTRDLVAEFEGDAFDESDVIGLAQELRSAVRPYA